MPSVYRPDQGIHSVGSEVVIKALVTRGVPVQYMKALQEFYNEFTTKTSPFYDYVTVNKKRSDRHGDATSPKLFSATEKTIPNSKTSCAI